MIEQSEGQIVDAARRAADAAGAILEGARGLAFAASGPDHGVLMKPLTDLMPACRALASSFPRIRGQVAGLIYLSVEHCGYRGSSALHIVAQISDHLLAVGELHLRVRELTPQILNRLAGELRAALPHRLDDWLRTTLDPELGALERRLGATITDEFHQFERSIALARIDRMARPFSTLTSRVVLAGAKTNGSDEESMSPSVEFLSAGLAIITEGRSRAEVRGERRVWVFRAVVEAAGSTVAWKDLCTADLVRAEERLREARGNRNPRMATNPDSFQRAGNHIRRVLGKFAYLWHQDGHGARWSAGEV